MKHTPGPWELHEGMIQREDDTLAPVGMVRGWGWLQKLPNGYETQCANGRLMAASPEMVEALIWVAKYVALNGKQLGVVMTALRKALSNDELHPDHLREQAERINKYILE